MLQNYIKLNNGVIKQETIVGEIKQYTKEYVINSYNKYADKSINMSYLRFGYLCGVIGLPNSILDVGYGNGDFLNVCKTSIENCYGNEVNGYSIPNGVTFVEDIQKDYYDVICFFDVLEHFEDIDFVSNLKCKWIYISVPWCHYHSDEWFKNWKHRRVDEHLYHFNLDSLVNFFKEKGFSLISSSNIEDMIRTSDDNNENILTAIFQKD